MQATSTNDPVYRITALWAFSECGLGGIMHAFKLPFTGLLVGGFAVLCIGMLAHVSGRKAGTILQALLWVLAVKAIVSPHSPPTAYAAVAFQGLLGAAMLCHMQPFRLAAWLFGFIAMVESALQKILMLLLFFGKPLVEAINLFIGDVLKNFGVDTEVSWANVLVWGYLGIYGLGGLLLGNWIAGLPAQMAEREALYAGLQFPETTPAQARGRKRAWLAPALVLGFVVLVFLFTDAGAKGSARALYAVLRSTAVLAAWFVVVQPLITGIIQRWAARKAASDKGQLDYILGSLPELRSKTTYLYQYISQHHKGWKKWREFVIALFLVATRAES